MEIDQASLDKIKLENASKELHQIDVEDGDDSMSIVVVAPTRIEWMRFLSDLTGTTDIAKKNMAHENIILAVAKWPERKLIQDFFSKKFGAITELTDKLGTMVGAAAKVHSKKL